MPLVCLVLYCVYVANQIFQGQFQVWGGLWWCSSPSGQSLYLPTQYTTPRFFTHISVLAPRRFVFFINTIFRDLHCNFSPFSTHKIFTLAYYPSVTNCSFLTNRPLTVPLKFLYVESVNNKSFRLCSSFWVILWGLNIMFRRFGTLCSTFIGGVKRKRRCSETLAHKKKVCNSQNITKVWNEDVVKG